MRLLVTGGRHFDNKPWLWGALTVLHPDEIVEGGATGADEIARKWAKKYLGDVITEKADWRRYGLAAGGIRNQKMLDDHKPDKVLACPGNSGTADMVKRARKAGIPIIFLKDKFK